MAIRIKYDPVGSLFLGSFANGLAQGQERRGKQWMEQMQKNAELFQRSSDSAASRRLQAQRDFDRNNVFVPGAAGALPSPATGMPDGKGGFTFSGPPDSGPIAGLLPAPGAAPGAVGGIPVPGGTMVDRRALKQQQDAQTRQYAFERGDANGLQSYIRGETSRAMPDRISGNPIAASRYGSLIKGLNDLVNQRTQDVMRPEVQEKIHEALNELDALRSEYAAKDPADVANENTRYYDKKEGKTYTEPGEGRVPVSISIGPDGNPTITPITVTTPEEQQLQQDKNKQAEDVAKAYDKERSTAEKLMLADIAAMRVDKENYKTKTLRDDAIKERIATFTKEWPAAGRPEAPAPDAAGGAPAGGAPAGPLPGLGGPGYTPPPPASEGGAASGMGAPAAGGAAPDDGIPTVTDRASYDALPPGRYRDTDGNIREKLPIPPSAPDPNSGGPGVPTRQTGNDRRNAQQNGLFNVEPGKPAKQTTAPQMTVAGLEPSEVLKRYTDLIPQEISILKQMEHLKKNIAITGSVSPEQMEKWDLLSGSWQNLVGKTKKSSPMSQKGKDWEERTEGSLKRGLEAQSREQDAAMDGAALATQNVRDKFDDDVMGGATDEVTVDWVLKTMGLPPMEWKHPGVSLEQGRALAMDPSFDEKAKQGNVDREMTPVSFTVEGLKERALHDIEVQKEARRLKAIGLYKKAQERIKKRRSRLKYDKVKTVGDL